MGQPGDEVPEAVPCLDLSVRLEGPVAARVRDEPGSKPEPEPGTSAENPGEPGPQVRRPSGLVMVHLSRRARASRLVPKFRLTLKSK